MAAEDTKNITYSLITLGAIVIVASFIVWIDKAYKSIMECNRKIRSATTISAKEKENKKNKIDSKNQENKSKISQKQNENLSETKEINKKKDQKIISDKKESKK